MAIPPGPKWMKDKSEIFLVSTTASEPDLHDCLEKLWATVVGAHFRYGRTFGRLDTGDVSDLSQSSSASGSFHSRGRGKLAPFSSADALRRGGRIDETRTSHGV